MRRVAVSVLVLLSLAAPVLGQLSVSPAGRTELQTDCSTVTLQGVFCLDIDEAIPVLYVGLGAGQNQRVGGDAYVVQNDCSLETQLGKFCLDGDAVPPTLYVGTGGGTQQIGPGAGSGDITAVAGCASGDCFASVSQNTVWAGPDGSGGAPTFRALAVGDLPAAVVREDLSTTFAGGTAHDFGACALEIPNSATLPATCTVGQIYMDTDATTGQRLYLCQAADTWVLQGDGGGGTPTLDAVMATGDTYSGADNPATALTVCNTADTECVELYIDATTGSRLRFRVDGTYQSLDERCEAAGDRDFLVSDGDTCFTINCTTGLWTFANEGTCKWEEAYPFSVDDLTVDGTHCVKTNVSMVGFPARPTISCADNDNGRIVYVMEKTPNWWDGVQIIVSLTHYSITNQNTLTALYDIQTICHVSGDQRTAPPATADLNRATITYGNVPNQIRHSNNVAITTTGCAAGEELTIIIDNDDAGTATQSSTTSFLTGGRVNLRRATSR